MGGKTTLENSFFIEKYISKDIASQNEVRAALSQQTRVFNTLDLTLSYNDDTQFDHTLTTDILTSNSQVILYNEVDRMHLSPYFVSDTD